MRLTLVLLGLALLLAAPAAARSAGGDASGDPRASLSPVATAPVGEPPVTVASGADDRWHAAPVTIGFTATAGASPVAATYVRVDGGAVVATTSVVVAAPSDHANDGVHTITYWSVDTAGRTEEPQSLQVKIDTGAPVVRGVTLRPTLLRRSGPVTVRLSFSDVSGAAAVSYVVSDQYGYLARRDRSGREDAGACLLTIPTRSRNGRAFDPGLFRVRVSLTDEAGNRTEARPLVFRDYHPVHARVTYHVNGAGKRVALTFDDGGPAWVWDRMLDTLKAYHMHATFFVVGPYVAAAPQVARRVVAEGHGIGSHGWTHAEMIREGYSGVQRELVRSEAPWWRLAKATPVGWMRPPYGSHNATTVAAAGSVGFGHFIMWDVDPGDWRGYGSSTIAYNTLSHVHSGAIIGLHVRTNTMYALPAILAGLRARGYESVSLPELFHAAGRR